MSKKRPGKERRIKKQQARRAVRYAAGKEFPAARIAPPRRGNETARKVSPPGRSLLTAVSDPL